ncbi:conjugative transposon protein TraM [Aquimarina sp. MMG016]|uniref:conjugative transposon protein TraM n=1 Tax=Aquimarina sp. MMG016 TaxID=2822690 RepID=UPI001B39DC74|nr:conjugative transposon protein TraM [Aquimarina sp. MMG016]MBQ4820594.1 conjugative transposon protein TraM [Aquimarina sp. MMG016]
MDKRKKIIVAIVGVLFSGILAGFVKLVVFPTKEPKSNEFKLKISTPKVDDNKIDRKSKLQKYAQEELDSLDPNITDAVKLLNNDSRNSQNTKELSIQDQLKEAISGGGLNPQEEATIQTQSANDELKQILELQEKLLSETNTQTPQQSVNNDVEDILKTYDQYIANYGQQSLPRTIDSVQNIAAPGGISNVAQQASQGIIGAVQNKLPQKDYFQGAVSSKSNKTTKDLIPAETVDQGVIVNGSTIAIRTKQDVRIQEPSVFIPKGSIVYGTVNISTNRLLIDITSYKKGNKLYVLDFSLFDFDGREGIHLGNRTWPKIPSKVAKDVYDYAYQRGTQAATFGGNNDIQLDEAKDVAILSGARELSNEVFEKRRVFMPRKYHLWFNIKSE